MFTFLFLLNLEYSYRKLGWYVLAHLTMIRKICQLEMLLLRILYLIIVSWAYMF